MAIKRIDDFPSGSGVLTGDDLFIMMDDPSGSSITKNISVSELRQVINSGVIKSDVSGLPEGSGIEISNIITVTQETYNNISQESGVLYVISDSPPVVKSDTSVVPEGSGSIVDNIITLTQTAYNDIVPESGVVYLISDAAPTVKSDISAVSGSGTTVDNIIILNQSTYNNITPDSGTLYIVSDASFDIVADTSPQLGGNLDINNYNLVGTGNTLINGSGDFASGLFVNNVPVSVSGHSHTTSDITDFDSAASGVINDTLTTALIGESGVSIVYNSGTDSLVFSATPISYYTVEPAISGIINDWSPSGVADILRASGIDSARINGLVDNYGVDVVLLYNVGDSGNITLTHASGTADNQFLVPWLGDYVLSPNGGAALIARDKVDNKWRIT